MWRERAAESSQSEPDLISLEPHVAKPGPCKWVRAKHLQMCKLGSEERWGVSSELSRDHLSFVALTLVTTKCIKNLDSNIHHLILNVGITRLLDLYEYNQSIYGRRYFLDFLRHHTYYIQTLSPCQNITALSVIFGVIEWDGHWTVPNILEYSV